MLVKVQYIKIYQKGMVETTNVSKFFIKSDFYGIIIHGKSTTF